MTPEEFKLFMARWQRDCHRVNNLIYAKWLEEAGMDALARQVGGNHYKGLKIQPVEFAMRNHWDCCAFSVLKYTSRHNLPTGKGKQDVEKASHFVDLREALVDYTHKPFVPLLQRIPMEAYIRENGIDEASMEAKALRHLESCVEHPGDKVPVQALKDSLNRLLADYD